MIDLREDMDDREYQHGVSGTRANISDFIVEDNASHSKRLSRFVCGREGDSEHSVVEWIRKGLQARRESEGKIV